MVITMQNNLYEVTIENGKYTWIVGPTGAISALRYGQPWIAEGEITIGSKALLCLIAELSDARQALKEIASKLVCNGHNGLDQTHYCPNCDNSMDRVREKARKFS